MTFGSLLWSNPWPVIAGAVCGFFTVIVAAETVVALVKQGLNADGSGGDL